MSSPQPSTRTPHPLRRCIAVALMLVFISPLVLPLFAATADPEASLPACCRRHGKHHCHMTTEMMAMLAASSGPALTTPPCPFYPTAPLPSASSPPSSLSPPGLGPTSPRPRAARAHSASHPYPRYLLEPHARPSHSPRLSALILILIHRPRRPATRAPALSRPRDPGVLMRSLALNLPKVFGLALLLCLLPASIARATVFSQLQGVVHDPQHRPLPDAHITLAAAHSAFTLSTDSNPEGSFTLLNIPLGDYTVTITHAGFETLRQSLTVHSDTSPILHFQLQIGSVSTPSTSPPRRRPPTSTPSLPPRSSPASTSPRPPAPTAPTPWPSSPTTSPAPT